MTASNASRIARWSILAALLLAVAVVSADAAAQDKGADFEDALITERVQSAFDRDPALRQMQISIETRDQVVHLRGVVHSVDQVDRAGALARRIGGVTAVRNAIRVAVPASRA